MRVSSSGRVPRVLRVASVSLRVQRSSASAPTVTEVESDADGLMIAISESNLHKADHEPYASPTAGQGRPSQVSCSL